MRVIVGGQGWVKSGSLEWRECKRKRPYGEGGDGLEQGAQPEPFAHLAVLVFHLDSGKVRNFGEPFAHLEFGVFFA